MIKRKTLYKFFSELGHFSDYMNHENICLVTIMLLLRIQVMKKPVKSAVKFINDLQSNTM